MYGIVCVLAPGKGTVAVYKDCRDIIGRYTVKSFYYYVAPGEGDKPVLGQGKVCLETCCFKFSNIILPLLRSALPLRAFCSFRYMR